MISSTVDTCITPRVRALWSSASVDDKTKYQQCVDLYLDYTYNNNIYMFIWKSRIYIIIFPTNIIIYCIEYVYILCTICSYY